MRRFKHADHRLIVALFFALIFTAVFSGIFQIRGPWASTPIFFIVIFLSTWAIGARLSPFGPGLWGGFWLPFFLMGLVVSLLLAACVVSVPKRETTVELVDTKEQAKERKLALTTLGAFFWILLIVLVLLISVRHL